MSILLRVILIFASIVTAICMFVKIRKSQIRIEDAVYWILTSFLLVLISIVPGIAEFFAHWIGIVSPANFIFLFIIFILLIKVFALSIKVSQLENKLQLLAQRFALQQHDVETMKNMQKNTEDAVGTVFDSPQTGSTPRS